MADFFFPFSYRGPQDAKQRRGIKFLEPVPGAEGHDPARDIGMSNWVFSYADMMTSMVVFLVLLLSFSQISYSKLKQISETAVQEAGGDLRAIRETPIEELEGRLAELDRMEGVSFQKEGQGASLIIKDSILFESGRAAILPEFREKIGPIFEQLKALPQDYHFIIEGHTDDNPIHSYAYASNWELSAARALSVLLFMKELGFEGERLSFHAFGEFDPLLPNRDEKGKVLPEHQTQNRRAVIKMRQRLDVSNGNAGEAL